MSDSQERFTVKCSRCEKRFVVDASAVGKKATCKCGNTFLIERPPQEEDEGPGSYGVTTPGAAPNLGGAPFRPMAPPMPPSPSAFPSPSNPYASPGPIPAAPLTPGYASPMGAMPAPAAPYGSGPPLAAPIPPAPAMGSGPLGGGMAGPRCRWHPNNIPVAACCRCRALICQACDVPQPDGSHTCPSCAQAAATMPAPAADPYAVSNPYAPAATPWAAAPALCKNHPTISTGIRCRQCNAAVCTVCDFQFAGGVHLCPDCATSGGSKMSRQRTAAVIWSLVLAGVASVGLVVVFVLLGSGELRDAPDLVVACVLRSPMAAASIAFMLSWGALDTRRGNPPSLWIALIWGSLMFFGPSLLYIILIVSMIAGGGQ
jgi:hypothetical protein